MQVGTKTHLFILAKAMVIQPFNPHEQVKIQNAKMHPRWVELSHGLDAKSLGDLRDLNAYWFGQVLGFEFTIPMLWQINRELSSRGIAPGWRGIPRFVQAARLPPVSPLNKGVRSLGEVAKKNLMKKWIDLEWLRCQLGSSHLTKLKVWQGAFADDFDKAVLTFVKVNFVRAHGGGKIGPRPAFKVVYGLAIPKLHRLGLTGLINRDAGELVRNMEKRLKTRIRPLLEAEMHRPAYPLTAAEVERRLLCCQAIELAVGSPTDATVIFRWITGESVTRQSMHEMKTKIAAQCNLGTRAWKPIARKTSLITYT